MEEFSYNNTGILQESSINQTLIPNKPNTDADGGTSKNRLMMAKNNLETIKYELSGKENRCNSARIIQ
jgi:hypothetical protein